MQTLSSLSITAIPAAVTVQNPADIAVPLAILFVVLAGGLVAL